MNQITKCEKCGAIMVPIKQEHTQGMICPNCGDGWVSSYFEPIDLDQTIYTLSIHKFDKIPSIEQLKLISKIFPSKNLLQIRKQIINEDFVLQERARKISEFAKLLSDSNMAFDIKPDFPYEF